MRISWGHKIFIAYTAFALGILFLAFKASQQNFDLVTEDYYEQELKYQEVIDQKSRTAQLSAPVQVTHSTSSLSIQLPAEFTNRAVQGEIYLYRASDAAKDIRKPFATNQASYDLAFGKELSGSYELKLSWEADGKRYFEEKRIFF